MSFPKIFSRTDSLPVFYGRYVLSDRLARFIGSKYERRSNVYMCFWQYIKRNNLQIDEDRSYVRIDTRLRELVSDVVSRTQPKVIEANRIRISSLFDLVKSHIRPDSVELECTYNMKNSSKPQQLCFDVAVEVRERVILQGNGTKSLNLVGPSFL